MTNNGTEEDRAPENRAETTAERGHWAKHGGSLGSLTWCGKRTAEVEIITRGGMPRLPVCADCRNCRDAFNAQQTQLAERVRLKIQETEITFHPESLDDQDPATLTPETPTPGWWAAYREGHTDGMDGRYTPRSTVRATHGYNAGHVDGQKDRMVREVYDQIQAEEEPDSGIPGSDEPPGTHSGGDRGPDPGDGEMADALMKSTAIGHLEQMQQDAQQAAEKHGSMHDAVERYLAGIPRRGSFGKTPRITEIQSRMLRHLIIRERHLEKRRHSLGLDYDLASMGLALDGICPVCSSVTPPMAEPTCTHMVQEVL